MHGLHQSLRVLSVDRLGYPQVYWDMQVPGTNNYVTADGSVHHNSGKSVGCVMELLRLAMTTPPDTHGIRRSRAVIVRNTARMLRDTTIKTVHEWVPPGAAGKWHASSQTYFLRFGDVESEWMFRPLDSPDDVSNLLSLELTFAWINEFREINRDIFVNLLGRVGRYPPKNATAEPPRFGIIMDSNPPNVGGFWYNLLEHGGSEDVQSALARLPGDGPLIEVFKQPSGRAPDAENVENLPAGYYDRMVAMNADKGLDWIKTHVDGEYGADPKNLPVYPEFRMQMHVADGPVAANPQSPLVLGFDYGRTPACVAMQCDALGRWNIIAEYFREGIGFEAFCEWLAPMLRQRFPDHKAHQYTCIGDPAGTHKAQSSDATCVAVGRAHGFIIRNGPQDLETRIGSVRKMLARILPDGRPALMVDPACRELIAGFAGEYVYERNNLEELRPEPKKNRASHCQDAVQYAIGWFEGPSLKGAGRRGSTDRSKPVLVRDWGKVYGR